MKITTESGSVYEIKDGLCNKYDSTGERIDAFKVWYMKVVPDWVTTAKEIYDLPDDTRREPEIGKRLYLGGKDTWWISTKVVSIEIQENL